jgi:hypothetical protein
MRFTRPIFRLPISFSAEALAREVSALPASAWNRHPDGFRGNEAVRLVSPGGQDSDGWAGPMAPTEHLRACPYVMEIMAELGGVWGRSRLMGLAPGAQVPPHIDRHYYWRTHLRLHIPVITNPAVTFTCGGETVHMAAGECWIFDSFQQHEVHNDGPDRRIHLVLDTVGGGRLPELLNAMDGRSVPAETLEPGRRHSGPLHFERVNRPAVMSPWEIRCHIRYLGDLSQAHPRLPALIELLERFADDWAALWARFGDDGTGLSDYQQLLVSTGGALDAFGGEDIVLSNGVSFYSALRRLVFEVALSPPAQDRPAARPQMAR